MPISQSQLDRLREHLHIAVIYSGDPSTRGNVVQLTNNPRGWKSYKRVAIDIANALRRTGFQHIDLIAEDKNFRRELEHKHIDIAWLNSAGLQGHDGIAHAAATLESLGIPYVGHRPSQSILLDNKYYFKMVAQALGIPTPMFIFWDARNAQSSIVNHPNFMALLQKSDERFIVKPLSGRASNHVTFIDTVTALDEAILSVNQRTDNGALVEAYLPGREFCVSVMGDMPYQHGQVQTEPPSSAHPICFSHLERILNANEKIFTSMDIRPITTERIKQIDPRREADIHNGLNRLGATFYTALSLTALVRADVRQDADGTLHILEINPKPDLRNTCHHTGSLLALGLAQSGVSYDELITSQLLHSLNHLFRCNAMSAQHLKAQITVPTTHNTATHTIQANSGTTQQAKS